MQEPHAGQTINIILDSGNGFTFDSGRFIQILWLYIEIMDFWHKLFPNKIYDLNYEKLTENQKIETEKLLKYCELDWDKNCLEFHKNDRGLKLQCITS